MFNIMIIDDQPSLAKWLREDIYMKEVKNKMKTLCRPNV
jgi:hypothetical protein